MSVDVAIEALIPNRNELDRWDALLPSRATVTKQEGGKGTTYTLGLDCDPLPPEDVFATLQDAAPEPLADTPEAVIDDWQEPDRQTQRARERVARHERIPGWREFMGSRHLFMRYVSQTPLQRDVEDIVRYVKPRDRPAAAAALLTTGRKDTYTATSLLGRVGLNRHDQDALVEADRERTSLQEAASIRDGLLERLAEMPEAVEAIIGAIYDPPKIRPLRQSPPAADSFLQVSHFFTQNYAVRLWPGNESPELFAKQYTYYSNSSRWLIQDSFATAHHGAESRLSAPLTDPHNPAYGSLAHFAVLEGSIKSRPGAPAMAPDIQWRTHLDGSRDFVLRDEKISGQPREVVQSGVFGVVLAASLQPEITERWPKTMRDPELDRTQRMGVAQVPVLALGRRRQLEPLLVRAEVLVG